MGEEQLLAGQLDAVGDAHVAAVATETGGDGDQPEGTTLDPPRPARGAERPPKTKRATPRNEDAVPATSWSTKTNPLPVGCGSFFHRFHTQKGFAARLVIAHR